MMVPGVDRWQIEHFQYIQIHVVIGKLQSSIFHKVPLSLLFLFKEAVLVKRCLEGLHPDVLRKIPND